MRKASLAAVASIIAALGGCFIKYDYDAFDGQTSAGNGGAGGAGGAQSSASATSVGGMGGAGGGMGGAGGGTGGEGGAGGGPIDPCGPICGMKYPGECEPIACATTIWHDRYGAVKDQRVNAVAADGTQVAFVGDYVDTAFAIGKGTTMEQVPASPDPGGDAYLAVVNSDPSVPGANGAAKWAMNLAVGSKPRAALGVAIEQQTYLVTGYANDTASGDRQVFVMGLKPSMGPTPTIIRVFGGDADDMGVAIASDGAGGAFVLGVNSGTTNSNKAISCNFNVYPAQGMFVAHFDGVGACKWFKQIEGPLINPKALAVTTSDVWVTGSFSSTMKFSETETVAAKGAEDMFVVRLSRSSWDIVDKATYGATAMGNGAIARGNSIAVNGAVGQENVYVGGYVKGSTALAKSLKDNQTAAIVAEFDGQAQLIKTTAYPGTGATAAGEEAYGTAVGFVNQALYFAGTISGPALINGYPTNTTGSDNHPFVAKLDPTSGATGWVHLLDGGGESFQNKSIYMAFNGVAPVLAATWIKPLAFPGQSALPFLGNGTDTDILIAKLSP